MYHLDFWKTSFWISWFMDTTLDWHRANIGATLDQPGISLNIKKSSYQYRNCYQKDRNSIIFKMGILYLERQSLYWDEALSPVGSREGHELWWILDAFYTVMSHYRAVVYNIRMHSYEIDLLHKSHNALLPCPTMHHFVTEMCTCVHISVTKWCTVGYLPDALWDLQDESIVKVG